jgi:hypothetical protein
MRSETPVPLTLEQMWIGLAVVVLGVGGLIFLIARFVVRGEGDDAQLEDGPGTAGSLQDACDLGDDR